MTAAGCCLPLSVGTFATRTRTPAALWLLPCLMMSRMFVMVAAAAVVVVVVVVGGAVGDDRGRLGSEANSEYSWSGRTRRRAHSS